jgi:hypothetical protein
MGRRRIVDSVATFELESTVFKPQFSTENFVYALGITARIDETQTIKRRSADSIIFRYAVHKREWQSVSISNFIGCM